jgi:hypothetical protein
VCVCGGGGVTDKKYAKLTPHVTTHVWLQAGWSFSTNDGGTLYYTGGSWGGTECDVVNRFNFLNGNYDTTNTGTMQATLSGNGCGTIVVKQCVCPSTRLHSNVVFCLRLRLHSLLR